MDKLYDYTKAAVVNFKLERCCCIAPIRTGLLIIGYFNVFIALISLVGTADGGITPPLMAVQELILEDNASKPVGILAYGTELAFNMLLLCAIYRKDIVLLRVYMYFVFVAIVSSLLVYSMVIAAISLLTKILIVWGIMFQCYVVILVRSAIVELKETRVSEKNGHVTLYSVVRTPDEVPTKSDENRKDVEAPVEPESSEHSAAQSKEETQQKKDEPPTKLETVNENSKEE